MGTACCGNKWHIHLKIDWENDVKAIRNSRQTQQQLFIISYDYQIDDL